MKTVIRELRPFVLLALIFAYMISFKNEATLTEEEIATIERQQSIIEEQNVQQAELNNSKNTSYISND